MNSIFTTDQLLTQENRFLQVQTPLGDDVFLLRALRGSEGFSRLFTFELDLLSHEADIDPLDLVGDHIATFIDVHSGEPKALNGFVRQFENTGLEYRGLYGYRATLVPWFWFFKNRIDCRVFQNMSVPDIFEALCQEMGYQDFQLSLNEDHPPLEYCVQYRESHFQFLSRLLENAGIFYFFEHLDDKHVMHLVDNVQSLVPLDEGREIEHSSGSRAEDCIRNFRHRYHFLSGKWAHNDFDYEKFTHALTTESSSQLNLKNQSQFEIFDYPGGFEENDVGEVLAKKRIEEIEGRYNRISGKSDIKRLVVGKLFTLMSNENFKDSDKSFVICDIAHEAVDSSLSESQTSKKKIPDRYENHFACLPEGAPFRPPPVTEKPRIDGVQTAVVVGKAGDEIYTDEYGRIKIQFHWDRYGQRDENSSCWVRVATPWAGKKWGSIALPRVGQEVVISFIDGDPDRPLVMASVYNSAHMPPYDLPAGKNSHGVKSRSTKGGDRGSFNELSFDDTKGSEKFTINAHKDFNMKVGKDSGSNTVGNATSNTDGNVTSTVGGDKSTTVSGNDTFTVSGNVAGSITGNRDYSVSGDQSEAVSGNDGVSVGGEQSISVGSSQSVTVGSAQTTDISADHTVNVGGSQAESVSGNQEISVGGSAVLSISGNHEITASNQSNAISGQALTDATEIALSGSASITLSVAGSSVTIDPSGVTIAMGASSVVVNAAGVTVSGPIVKLN